MLRSEVTINDQKTKYLQILYKFLLNPLCIYLILLFKNLPRSIGDLENLEILNLYANHMKEVPFEISRCQNLTKINLKYNLNLETVQQWMDCLILLPQLKCLEINSAYLEYLPKKLIEKKDLEIITDPKKIYL